MSKSEVYFGTKASVAPEEARLEFLTNFTIGCRTLLEEGAHKPFIRIMMRDAIFHQWEHPQLIEYPERHFSKAAWRLRPLTKKEMRNKLRRDHVIPLNIVIDRLLRPEASVSELLRNRERVSVRFITIEEDKKLTNMGLSSKMPQDWNWDTGAIHARYQSAGIKFNEPVRKA